MIKESPTDERIHEMHAELCRMLSHPTRLKILEQLKSGEKTVSEIVETLDINQPTVSQHLRKLKKSGLVSAERDGAHMRYEIVYPKILDACDITREVLFDQLSENQELLDKGKGGKDG
ncbi:MAG: metalloregulator ArsR/SmtB family transcription factor [Candidatus Thermoplasmatota archaeon]